MRQAQFQVQSEKPSVQVRVLLRANFSRAGGEMADAGNTRLFPIPQPPGRKAVSGWFEDQVVPHKLCIAVVAGSTADDNLR
ncbi:MAG TPA: hypothetical protein VGB45_09490 [Abditibacterium sp.]|jgi:hypothetical protein